MTKALSSDHSYNGRRPDTVVLNCCLHREAATLLREYAGGGRKLGAFVSRLIYEHHARQVARTEIREQLITRLKEP